MNKQKTLSYSIATSLLFGNLLYAQESQSLDIVTVTANKMEENIKDIPQSITVMTDVEIEERGIKNISDLIEYIPNLNSSGTINFRGLNYSPFTNTSPMTIYVDGVPYTHMWGFDKTISNILRVEVLRGPQGSIYGKDSMGGVINIVTKDPSNTLEGSISAEYGSHNTKETAFDISSPLIDNKLFVGINGFYSQSDGDVTNHYVGSRGDKANEKDRYLGNVKLLYKPTDNLSVKFQVSKENHTRHGLEGVAVPRDTDINIYERDDFKDVTYDQESYRKDKSNTQSLHADYDFDGMTLSSLTTHKVSGIDAHLDADKSYGTPRDGAYYYMEFDTKNLTQEFRLSSDSKRLRWVTGVYFEKEENDIVVHSVFPMGGNVFVYDASSENTSNIMATFGQVIIPFSEDYELTLGGRYQSIKKKIDLEQRFYPQGNLGDPNFILDEDKTMNAFLPKVALSYKINNDLNSYFSITKGYLAGGYNYNASDGRAVNSFDAQKSTNYELGMRGDLLDNRLYLSAAIFYMDIKDLQVFSMDESGIRSASNAGKAHSQGIELELGYTINDNWRIDSALGLVEAKYDDYITTNGIDLKDEKIQKTPSHTANIGVSYFNDNGVYGRFDIKNQGKIYFDETNKYKGNSYTLANIKVGYLFDDWDIYAYAHNVTDESYITDGTVNSVTFGDGSFISVGAKYTF
ncbi:MAG: TonB-dependent receptor [Epsilonproteobacteria bacterium]|nr:TonB-dependent receptor [Campylobacterota bacterium]